MGLPADLKERAYYGCLLTDVQAMALADLWEAAKVAYDTSQEAKWCRCSPPFDDALTGLACALGNLDAIRW